MAGNMNAADLGIDTSKGDKDALFRWFLASLLFGRPIQQQVAANAWRVLIDHGLTSPGKFADCDREELRKLLDEGNYARFDYVMSDELREVMRRVEDDYGSVNGLIKRSESKSELKNKLKAFKGVGPKTAEIFLREVPEDLIGSA